jgi:hypothetical protein
LRGELLCPEEDGYDDARADLIGRGVEVGEVQVFDDGAYRPAREGEDLDLVGFAFFGDPDGNRWCVQQIPARDPPTRGGKD